MRQLKKELWPSKIVIKSDDLADITPIETWLSERYGAFKGRWNVVYQLHETHFYFRETKDATIFALKWS